MSRVAVIDRGFLGDCPAAWIVGALVAFEGAFLAGCLALL
jgi:hypothetical protein